MAYREGWAARADGAPVRHAPAVGRKMSYNQSISLREYGT